VRILSLCTSAGLWDKAWLSMGHEVVPGCEIMPHKRAMYQAWCGGEHLCHDLADLPARIKGMHFDGIIGGIPCQSRSITRAMRAPKFPDLLPQTLEVLEACSWDWYLMENVAPLDIPGSVSFHMDAMHYGFPHQSRSRTFTHSPNLKRPTPLFSGDIDSLMAYPSVVGKLYGPRRGARLQGWDAFADLPFPCTDLQEALADGVPRCLAMPWITSIESMSHIRLGYAMGAP
jgi:site-specific DNA-cytosine methylase